MRSSKLWTLALVSTLTACGPKVASLEVTPQTVELKKTGAVAGLATVAKTAEGAKVERVQLGYVSSDPAIASVDATGKITAHKSGDAKISITADKVSAAVPVKVSIPASVTVSPDAVQLDALGAKTRVFVKIVDEKGRPVSETVSWQTSDPKIATVIDGEITAVGAGETVVTASAAGLRSLAKVIVVLPQVASIAADKGIAAKIGGAPVKIQAMAKDAEGKDLPAVVLTYAVDKPKVATVDAGGTVTGIGKGTAVVTVSADGKTAAVEVKVKK
jgi:uncharacterized protein YjdB